MHLPYSFIIAIFCDAIIAFWILLEVIHGCCNDNISFDNCDLTLLQSLFSKGVQVLRFSTIACIDTGPMEKERTATSANFGTLAVHCINNNIETYRIVQFKDQNWQIWSVFIPLECFVQSRAIIPRPTLSIQRQSRVGVPSYVLEFDNGDCSHLVN